MMVQKCFTVSFAGAQESMQAVDLSSFVSGYQNLSLIGIPLVRDTALITIVQADEDSEFRIYLMGASASYVGQNGDDEDDTAAGLAAAIDALNLDVTATPSTDDSGTLQIDANTPGVGLFINVFALDDDGLTDVTISDIALTSVGMLDGASPSECVGIGCVNVPTMGQPVIVARASDDITADIHVLIVGGD